MTRKVYTRENGRFSDSTHPAFSELHGKPDLRKRQAPVYFHLQSTRGKSHPKLGTVKKQRPNKSG